MFRLTLERVSRRVRKQVCCQRAWVGYVFEKPAGVLHIVQHKHAKLAQSSQLLVSCATGPPVGLNTGNRVAKLTTWRLSVRPGVGRTAVPEADGGTVNPEYFETIPSSRSSMFLSLDQDLYPRNWATS